MHFMGEANGFLQTGGDDDAREKNFTKYIFAVMQLQRIFLFR